MHLSIRILIPLFAIFIVSCGKNSDRAIMVRNGDVVRYSGMITPESAEKLVPLLRGASTLIIYSGGGDVDASILIGNAVVDNGTAVEVETLCSSSCAHYIFAVGSRKIVPDGAAVIFHTSPFTWDQMAREGQITDSSVIESNKNRLAKVISLYNRVNVSPSVLICTSNAIGVRPETIRPSPIGGLRANTRFAGVYFSEEQLEDFGFSNLDQAYDLSDNGRLAFRIEDRFIRVVQPGACRPN